MKEAHEAMQEATQCRSISLCTVEAATQKSGGLPIFVHQLSMYLHEGKLLGEFDAHVLQALNDGDAVADSIRKSISTCHPVMDAIDGLSPSSQLTLKLVAVVGHNATVELATSIYPYATHFHAVESDFLELEDTGLLLVEEENQILSLNFNCTTTRDIIYALIPNEQRRNLHAKMAEVVQSIPEIAVENVAYHWTQSVIGLEAIEWRRTLKAINRWESAAEEAIAQGNILKAIDALENSAHLQECLDEYYSKLDPPTETVVSKLILESAEPTPPTPKERPKLTHKSSFRRSLERVDSEMQLFDAALVNLPYVPTLKMAATHRSLARLMIQKTSGVSQSDSHAIKTHLLQALYLLGAPLPGEDVQVSKKHSLAKSFITKACRQAKVVFKIRKQIGAKKKYYPIRRRPSMSYYLLKNLGHPVDYLCHRQLYEQEIVEAQTVLDMLVAVSTDPRDTPHNSHVLKLQEFFSGKQHTASIPQERRKP